MIQNWNEIGFSMTGVLEAIARRAEIYRVLSNCYHVPNEELFTTLREADIHGLRFESEPPALDDLQRDYASLFVGPFETLAPPYGSLYLESDHQVCGESTKDVIVRYKEEGLEVSLKEPADHVAIELEFMYLLVYRQQQVTNNGDDELAARYIQKQCEFLHRHLGVWLPLLTERIINNARTEFYKQVARFSGAFIHDEWEICCNSNGSRP